MTTTLADVRAAYERGDRAALEQLALTAPSEFLTAVKAIGVQMPFASWLWLRRYAQDWERLNTRKTPAERAQLARAVQEADEYRKAEARRVRARLLEIRELKEAQDRRFGLKPTVPLIYQIGVVAFDEMDSCEAIEARLVRVLETIRDQLLGI